MAVFISATNETIPRKLGTILTVPLKKGGQIVGIVVLLICHLRMVTES